MDYITTFIAHLFANLGGIFGSPSTLHSTTTLGGTWTTSVGTNTIDSEDALVSTIGTSVVSLGTAVIEAGDDAYNEYRRQVSSVQTTQAYIESLPESDLDELIASLSTEEELEVPAPQEEVRTLAKRL